MVTTTQILKKEGNILEGPGKWDLASAIMDGKEVVFTLEGFLNRVIVCIDTLQREDGSSQSWNILGWVPDSTVHKELGIPRTPYQTWRVYFYYHSGRRKGYYEIATE